MDKSADNVGAAKLCLVLDVNFIIRDGNFDSVGCDQDLGISADNLIASLCLVFEDNGIIRGGKIGILAIIDLGISAPKVTLNRNHVADGNLVARSISIGRLGLINSDISADKLAHGRITLDGNGVFPGGKADYRKWD